MAHTEKTSQIYNTIIPTDWELMELGKIAKITSGGTPSRENKSYWGGNIPWITTSLIDFNEIETAEQFITDAGLKNSSSKLFAPGTLLIALYGQGVTRGKTAILKIEAATNQACAAIILDETLANKQFIFQYLVSKYEDIRKLSNTGNQENLNGELVKSIKLNLPPVAEQEAIAQILRTWDEGITKTQALIAQKEQRKKWLMQNLLTGKKRLKINDELRMMNDELKKVNLKDVFQFIKSYSVSRDGLKTSEDKNSTYCIHYGDIHSLYENEFLDFANQHNIPQLINVISINETDYLQNGDIIMADASEDYEGVGEAAEVCNIEKRKAIGGLHTIVLRGNTKIISPKYAAYLFSSENVRNNLRKMANGTSVYSVSKSTLYNLSLIIHNSLKEQTAIVQVLQAADKEIQLLKTIMDKLKEQKKGLMQVLLTGKKRLKL